MNRFTSQLLTLVAEKRVSRPDGSLLAYIASLLLQTIAPVRRKPSVERVEEFVESVAEPIRDRRAFARGFASPVEAEPQMPGRTDNPYMYPTKLR